MQLKLAAAIAAQGSAPSRSMVWTQSLFCSPVDGGLADRLADEMSAPVAFAWCDEWSLKDSPIGGGAFGHVVRAMHNDNGTVAACKIADDGVSLRHEIDLLRRCAHPHVVALVDGAPQSSRFILLELAPGGDLFGRISPAGLIGGDEALRTYTDDVLCALEHLHSLNVVHFDVKPRNVLLFPPSAPGRHERAKLCDLGISLDLDSHDYASRAENLATLQFRAPELPPHARTLHRQLLKRADMWSLGVVVYFCVYGAMPWNGAPAPDDRAFLRLAADGPDAAARVHGVPPWGGQQPVSAVTGQLLAAMLRVPPEARATATCARALLHC